MSRSQERLDRKPETMYETKRQAAVNDQMVKFILRFPDFMARLKKPSDPKIEKLSLLVHRTLLDNYQDTESVEEVEVQKNGPDPSIRRRGQKQQGEPEGM